MHTGRFESPEAEQRELERSNSTSAHRNMEYAPEWTGEWDLQPGDGLYVPVGKPHWVANGADRVGLAVDHVAQRGRPARRARPRVQRAPAADRAVAPPAGREPPRRPGQGARAPRLRQGPPRHVQEPVIAPTVEILDRVEDCDALRGDWDALADGARQPAAASAWLGAWAEHVSTGGAPRRGGARGGRDARHRAARPPSARAPASRACTCSARARRPASRRWRAPAPS